MTPTKRDDLLPCPFCGHQPTYLDGIGPKRALWCSSSHCRAQFALPPDYPDCDAKLAQMWNRRARPEAQGMKHAGNCATDQSAHDVCEGMYSDRVDDVLELCDALNAVRALAGEDPEILKIVDDAIREHGIRE